MADIGNVVINFGGGGGPEAKSKVYSFLPEHTITGYDVPPSGVWEGVTGPEEDWGEKGDTDPYSLYFRFESDGALSGTLVDNSNEEQYIAEGKFVAATGKFYFTAKHTYANPQFRANGDVYKSSTGDSFAKFTMKQSTKDAPSKIKKTLRAEFKFTGDENPEPPEDVAKTLAEFDKHPFEELTIDGVNVRDAIRKIFSYSEIVSLDKKYPDHFSAASEETIQYMYDVLAVQEDELVDVAAQKLGTVEKYPDHFKHIGQQLNRQDPSTYRKYSTSERARLVYEDLKAAKAAEEQAEKLKQGGCCVVM